MTVIVHSQSRPILRRADKVHGQTPRAMGWIKRASAVLLILGMAIVGVPRAIGQMNTGDIIGTVSDPTGAIIEGAEVAAINHDTQQKLSAVTNGAGQYLLTGLLPGSYQLTADAPGFKQALAEHVSLRVNEHLRQDFSLQLGDAKETVIVQVTPGLVQTESAEIKDVIEN